MSRTGSNVVIAGCVSDPGFYRCCQIGKTLEAAGIGVDIASDSEMHETQFDEFLARTKTRLGGNIFEHKARHVVLLDGGDKYIGGVEELIRYAQQLVPSFERGKDESVDWVGMARMECEKILSLRRRPLVFMDIAQDPSSRPQRLVFQLYDEVCPKTCENFRALCTGEKGKTAKGKRLSYKGTPIHRVVRDGWIQGGDIVSGAGDGGVSIYGEVFGDENFAIRFEETGVLAMANDGPHTNASQFLVTLAPQPWLDHKVVGFGRLIMGMKTLREMSEVETLNQRPIAECKIFKCGELTPAEYAEIMCK